MSHKFAERFANAIRSWPFFIIFLAWTIFWWSFIGNRFGDPKPWLIWSLITTFITEVDLIVYGIYQRAQAMRDDLMQQSQLDTMRLLVALAEQLTKEQDAQGVMLHEILEIEEAKPQDSS